jgi:LCP family protein required for cell wall assembly
MQPDRDETVRFRHPDALSSDAGFAGEGEAPVYAPEPGRRTSAPLVPRRRGRLRRLFGFLFLIIVLSAIGYGVYLLNIVAKISTNPWQITPVAADDTGRTNVLVMGIGDPGHSGADLTDTLMLVSFDSTSHRIAQVSVPRDLRVKIDGYGYSKINAANADGGTELAEQTVADTLGVPINYYVKTNFSGLEQLVDAVGGLDIDVKDRLADSEYPCADDQYKSCGLVIESGVQHMDGARVLQYVRCRKGTCGNDFGRAARQQEVIGLLRPKLTDAHLLLNPVKLQAVVAAVQQGVKTDLGLWQMLNLANAWRADAANQPVHLVLSNGPGGYLRSDPAGSSDLLPIGGNFSQIWERVRNIFSADEQ